jgi:predicted metalloprotease with PDZ domain
VLYRGIVLAILALGVAAPAPAGSTKGAKCTESTQTCLNQMAAKMKDGGWVGVELDRNEATGLLVVTKVVEGSPAETAGIEPGDVLYALNGIEIRDDNREALAAARKEWKAGQLVNYTIKRNGADRQVALTLAPMPADLLAKWIGSHMLEHATVEAVDELSKK